MDLEIDEPPTPYTIENGVSPPSLVERHYAKARLVTVDDICKELAKLYREARSGRIDVTDASKLANMLSILSRIKGDSDLEARLERLEGKEIQQ